MFLSFVPIHFTKLLRSTANVIMANWSREMWQGVLNRAIRVLAAGPFASQFSFASEAVG
ncbi:hypothetical protein KIN20_017336 [Parelaphostrongylus tenuis]|uniref:Uncharacterized protein n=1 Tax=Parelaphostrongylus tenuis TaxID=148309 RepID=A0AAD5QNK9_PARTN|nr:hypothetical protein KIN20_017336 [Parelaphostrongylus tenuis]